MRLALITDTDQPGQSGVGDYALLLKGRLESMGVTAKVFPLGGSESSLRKELPARMSAFEPDWVSFQFVPYAYAQRGLVTRRTLPWKSLRGKTGTHFMFHEIWIGSHVGARLLERATGWLQRRGIQSIVRQVRPEVMHCSNRLYSALLARASIVNQVLPLFGNVPVAPEGIDPFSSLVASLSPGSGRQDWYVVAFFGTIHSGTNVLQVLRWLQHICQRLGRRLLIASLGRCPDAEQHFGTWSQALGATDSLRFVVKGEMPPHELSAWLGAADCGVSTTPYNIIEKSGSAVAFAEHGVPVLVTDSGSPVRGVNPSLDDLAPRYILAEASVLARMKEQPSRLPRVEGIDGVAATFLRHLQEASVP